ncbi:hypothetical protein CSUI_000912 [Cystoisospora suis]|uniref:Uncharacterized protein n=1 Tax=Cystoisospora suis TaxID=483139 RepID=A0A2C6LDK0_9APIC|nr:hypothetical protein CSUI_000912 [Cystoisospora suis]
MVPPSDMRLERERKGENESRERRNLLSHHPCAGKGGEGERRLTSNSGSMPGGIFHQDRVNEKGEEVDRMAGGRAKGRRVAEDSTDENQQRQKEAAACVKKEENEGDRKQPPREAILEGGRKKPLGMIEEAEEEEKTNKNDDAVKKQAGGGENEKKKSYPRRKEHLSSCSLSSSSSKENEDRHHGGRSKGDQAVPRRPPPPAPSKCHTSSRRERSSVKTTTSDEEESEEEDEEEERERTSKLPVTADYTLISRGLVDLSHVQLEASRDPEEIPPPNVGDWVESKAAHQDAQIFRAKVVERRRCPVNLWIFRLRSPDMTSTYIEPLKHVRKDNVWSLAREMDLAGGRKARRSASFNYLRRGGGSHVSHSASSARSSGGGGLSRGNGRSSESLSPRATNDRSAFQQKSEEVEHSFSSVREDSSSAAGFLVSQVCKTEVATSSEDKLSRQSDVTSPSSSFTFNEEKIAITIKPSDETQASYSPGLHPSLPSSSFSASFSLPYPDDHSTSRLSLPPGDFGFTPPPPPATFVPGDSPSDEGKVYLRGCPTAEKISEGQQRSSSPGLSDSAGKVVAPLMYVHPHSRRRDLILRQQHKRASVGNAATMTGLQTRDTHSMLFTPTAPDDEDKENRSNNTPPYFPGGTFPLLPGKNQQKGDTEDVGRNMGLSGKVHHRRLSDPSALSTTGRPSSGGMYSAGPPGDQSQPYNQGHAWISRRIPSDPTPHHSSTTLDRGAAQNTDFVTAGDGDQSHVSPRNHRHLSPFSLDSGRGLTDTSPLIESLQCERDTECATAKSKFQVRSVSDGPSEFPPPTAHPRRSLPAYHHLEKIFSRSKLPTPPPSPFFMFPRLSAASGLPPLNSQERSGATCSQGESTTERFFVGKTSEVICGQRRAVSYRKSDGAVMGMRSNDSLVRREGPRFPLCSETRSTRPQGILDRDPSCNVSTLKPAGSRTTPAVSFGGNAATPGPVCGSHKRRSSGSASARDEGPVDMQGEANISIGWSSSAGGEKPLVASKRLHRQSDGVECTLGDRAFHSSECPAAGSRDIGTVFGGNTMGGNWTVSSDEVPPTLLGRFPVSSVSSQYSSKTEDRAKDTCKSRDLSESGDPFSEGLAECV